MSDLLVIIQEIQLGPNRRVTSEIRLSNCEQAFDQKLHSLVDLPLVQDVAQSIETRGQSSRREVVKERSAFRQEGDSELDAVVARVFEQVVEQLECECVVRDSLVHEVRDELRKREEPTDFSARLNFASAFPSSPAN
ncbi:unnamed protein product [Linum trigynum]|uniref:Uncharacterized protein n=1 Tax=Linum trigynum TaxID=586398 RepID=A0AAV2F3U7_9ROSI